MRQSLGWASTRVCVHEAQIESHGREAYDSAYPIKPLRHGHGCWFQASRAGLDLACRQRLIWTLL